MVIALQLFLTSNISTDDFRITFKISTLLLVSSCMDSTTYWLIFSLFHLFVRLLNKALLVVFASFASSLIYLNSLCTEKIWLCSYLLQKTLAYFWLNTFLQRQCKILPDFDVKAINSFFMTEGSISLPLSDVRRSLRNWKLVECFWEAVKLSASLKIVLLTVVIWKSRVWLGVLFLLSAFVS